MQKCFITALNKNPKTKIQQIHRLFKYRHHNTQNNFQLNTFVSTKYTGIKTSK